jgi:hypothetical protein
MKIFVACLAIALTSVTTACSGGGGGGGSGSSANSGDNSSGSGSGNPQPTENLASISTPPQPWTIPATTLSASDSSGNTYSLSISNVNPGGTVTYQGQVADTVVLGLGLSENGAVLQTESTTLFYATNPFDPLGLSGSLELPGSTVPYTAAITSFTPFPATLTVGSSGPVLTATYKDTSGTVIGTLTETYTVTADSPSALFVNIDTSGTLNGSAIGQTISYSLSDTGSGTPTLTDVQLAINGATLTFH